MTVSGQMPSKPEQPFLPGRLGDPGRVLKTDPRADPRMVAALAEFGFDEAPPPAPVTAESPLEEILKFIAAAEPGYQFREVGPGSWKYSWAVWNFQQPFG